MHIVEIGGPVTVGHLRVAPGDLPHGDQHGVVQIPAEIADKIPATVARLHERERAIVQYCQSSTFTIEGLRRLNAGSACSPPDSSSAAH